MFCSVRHTNRDWTYEFVVQGRNWDGAINTGVLTLCSNLEKKRKGSNTDHGHTIICWGDEEELTNEMRRSSQKSKKKPEN